MFIAWQREHIIPTASLPQNVAQKQELLAALHRDFATEALRVASLKASHAADDLTIGDDIAAERSIAIAISHLREAAAALREMQNAGGSP